MSTLFHHITRQAALADLADLPHRIRATTYTTKRGPEGRTCASRPACNCAGTSYSTP